MIENEYVTLPIENYDDIFKLSEYFNISKIKQELESIEEEELFNDFEFTLQRIIAKHKGKHEDKYKNRNDDSWKLSKKEEEFLTTRINECLKHPLFRELPASIVYRAVAGNPKEKIDFNLVLDFILNSKENAFIILNLIELHHLSEEKISDLLEFICEQEEETQRIYSQYIPFDRRYIERILEDKSELQRELGETKKALEMTNRLKEQINDELEHTKTRLAEKENEVKQLNEYLIGSKNENQRLREELEMKNKENNELRDELTITNEEMKLKQTEIQQVNTSLLQAIDENNRMKATIEHRTNEFTKKDQKDDTKTSTQKDDSEKVSTFEHNDQNEFHGIIRYLFDNPATRSSIAVSSSSNYNADMQEKNVLIFDKDHPYFSSKDKSNSWICFDFTRFKVSPTSYTIKSIPYPTDNYHPQSWMIEASNDQICWETLDVQKGCNYLNGPSRVHTFDVNMKRDSKYRYIRMRQTDLNCGGLYFLEIKNFEIYGKLFTTD